MRPTGIGGIILILLGVFILLWGGSFTTKRHMLSVGDLKVTASEQHTIPGWTGALAIVAGVGLLVVGVRKRA